ncbi:cystein proteinase inhibitor protein salarin-like [Alosa pseudoharengus]|uniref:cystein proteinase inhibitor protein salarin-like n=1 Tax=Alosa pseudoharengus TaxID=34774 RepID=UPI003F8BBFDF
MKWLIIAAASLAVVSCASLPKGDVEQEFQAWKLQFGKVYKTPEEEAKRKDIWLAHRSVVLAHNTRADQGTETFHMGMNQFSDLTDEEMMKNANHMLRPDASRI